MYKSFFPLLFLLLWVAVIRAQDTAILSGAQHDSLDEVNYHFHKKPVIAVLPFPDANAKAKETEFGRTVSAMMVTALRSDANFTVIEHSELQKFLPDQANLSDLAVIRPDKSRESLPVDVVLGGDVSLIDNTLHIDARLFDIRSAKIVTALYGTCTDLKTIRPEIERLVKALEQSYLRQWMGIISITSQPSEAEVYLEERFVGVTSDKQALVISDLLEGKYRLKLILGGFYDWEGEIAVMAKMERTVRVSLIAKPGSININSEPRGAQIFLDNTYVGITPMSLKRVAEGEHEIRLEKENYKIWTSKVMVRSFKPTDVKTTLEVSPGTITVNSDPPGADIYLKGKLAAKSPHTLDNIPPGEVALRIEKAGYDDWTTAVLVKPNSHEALDIVLKEKVGKLSVTSKPDGADIFMARQGQPEQQIGQTPLINYITPIGKYSVRLDKQDYFPMSEIIEVKTEEIANIDLLLKEKPGSIMVTTEPGNARVFLNGVFKGRAPLRLTNLKKGEYLVTMSLPYASESVTVTVESNRESTATATLSKPVQYVFGFTLTGLAIMLIHSMTR